MGADVSIDRFLSQTGRDSEELAARKLRGMRRLVLLTLACEGWAALRYVPYSESPGSYGLVAAGLGVCALLGWHDRFAQQGVLAALALQLGTLASVFPESGNHQILAVVFLVLLALAAPGPVGADRAGGGESRAAVQAIRWIVLSGLFWSGVMKLWYGHWLGGEFLSFRIATDPGFAWIFAPVLPESELARLVALDPHVGAGPFRAQAPTLVAISNATWLAELLLPVGLLFERTRAAALIGALVLMAAIQLGAREIFFAGLMVGGLLLFARRNRVSAFLPMAGGVYLTWLLWPQLRTLLTLGAQP